MNYVYAGYSITFVVLALYSLRVVMRGRALRRALPQAVPAPASSSASSPASSGPAAQDGS